MRCRCGSSALRSGTARSRSRSHCAGEPVASLGVLALNRGRASSSPRVFALPDESGSRRPESWYICTLPSADAAADQCTAAFGALSSAVGGFCRTSWGAPNPQGWPGYVDHASAGGYFTGWAADLRDPARRLTIDVMTRGSPSRLGACRCCPAPDLEVIGVVASCGFAIPKDMFKDLRNGDALCRSSSRAPRAISSTARWS